MFHVRLHHRRVWVEVLGFIELIRSTLAHEALPWHVWLLLLNGLYLIVELARASPRNTCESMHLQGGDGLLRLVDWVHHVLVDLPIDEQMRSVLSACRPVVRLHVRVGLLRWIVVLRLILLIGAVRMMCQIGARIVRVVRIKLLP